MAISSITSSSTPQYVSTQRPDSAKTAEQIFKNLDTTNKGYIDKADLQAAFKEVVNTETSDPSASATAATADVDKLVQALDASGDGKITKDELTDGLQKLTDQMDAQFNAARTTDATGAQGAGGAKPAGGGGGAAPAGGASATTAYDPADTNQDGTVTSEEQQAYEQTIAYLTKHAGSEKTDAADSVSTVAKEKSTPVKTDADAEFARTLQLLARAYGDGSNAAATSGSAISVTA